jgi:hypothetical protein
MQDAVQQLPPSIRQLARGFIRVLTVPSIILRAVAIGRSAGRVRALATTI